MSLNQRNNNIATIYQGLDLRIIAGRTCKRNRSIWKTASLTTYGHACSSADLSCFSYYRVPLYRGTPSSEHLNMFSSFMTSSMDFITAETAQCFVFPRSCTRRCNWAFLTGLSLRSARGGSFMTLQPMSCLHLSRTGL